MRPTQQEIVKRVQVSATFAAMSDAELCTELLGRLATYPEPRSPVIQEAIRALLAVIPELAAEERPQSV